MLPRVVSRAPTWFSRGGKPRLHRRRWYFPNPPTQGISGGVVY